MGIVLVAAVWLFWFLFSIKTKRNKAVYVLAALAIIAFTYTLMSSFDFLKEAVERITGSSGGMTALQGRIFWWDTYFSNFPSSRLFFGYGWKNLPNVYFTGFMEFLYAGGIFAVFLMLLFLALCFFKSNLNGKLVILVYSFLFFVANNVSPISLFFSFGVFVSLIYDNGLLRQK